MSMPVVCILIHVRVYVCFHVGVHACVCSCLFSYQAYFAFKFFQFNLHIYVNSHFQIHFYVYVHFYVRVYAHFHARCSCNMFMQDIHVTYSWSCSLQHRHATKIFNKDMLHWQPAWTCSMVMQPGHINMVMQKEHSARICSMGNKRGSRGEEKEGERETHT
jgi:hypothetical protein